jgi:Brp/Blh family beta-carotene 15,15'-monooxygenase
MNLERWQGRAFAVLALLTAALTVNPPPLLLAILVLLLGVPHGAFDPFYVARRYRPSHAYSWLLATFLYLAAAAAVIGLWRLHPLLFLTGFLLISAWHFAADPAASVGLPARLLYGGAIIVLPTLIHDRAVTAIFAMLIDAGDAAWVGGWLHHLAPAWLLGLASAGALKFRSDFAIEATALGLLAVCAPPLAAFTVFFCVMHGPRHVLRTQRWLRLTADWRTLGVLGATLLMLAPLLLLGWRLLQELPSQTRIVQILFVGLAALTVPHMVVVGRENGPARSHLARTAATS